MLKLHRGMTMIININQKIPSILHYIWITNPNDPSVYPMCNEIELSVSFLDYDAANLWSNLYLKTILGKTIRVFLSIQKPDRYKICKIKM